MQHIRTVLDHDFEYVGGDISADFANTQSYRYQPTQAHDHLGTYADLVAFLRQGDAISGALARRLLVAAERHPDKAARVHHRAVALREAIWQCYSKIAKGKEPSPADVELIGREAADAMGHAVFAPSGSDYRWVFPDTDELERALWPVARAATDVLSNASERSMVRECADDVCAWLFLDRSKNHTRRWCTMETCGNRAKQRRFQKRAARIAR